VTPPKCRLVRAAEQLTLRGGPFLFYFDFFLLGRPGRRAPLNFLAFAISAFVQSRSVALPSPISFGASISPAAIHA